MKKNDWILIVLVAAVAGFFLVFQFLKPVQGTMEVEISIDGELYGRYNLEEEQKIEIHDTNLVEISEGTVKMIWASCPDQLCVHHKKISKDGESIICLPNKIVVSVTGSDEGSEENEFDAVAN